MKKNIFFIGPMGAGKSLIGNLLSKKIKYNFYDSDLEIKNIYNNNIKNIYNIKGETVFRKIEENIIKKISNMQNIILSTGGGAIESLYNRKILTKNGIVILLDVNLKNQIYRIKNNIIDRPILINKNKEEIKYILNKLYNKRILLYKDISDLIIDTNDISINTIINNIIIFLKKTNIIN